MTDEHCDARAVCGEDRVQAPAQAGEEVDRLIEWVTGDDQLSGIRRHEMQPYTGAMVHSVAMRATDLASKRAVAAVYFARASTRLAVGAALVALAVRVIVGQWGIGDVLIVAGTALLTGPVEWVIHLVLLHAPENSYRMRVMGTGVGHRRHHLDPPDLGWIMLTTRDMATFLPMLAVFSAGWSLPVLFVADQPVLPGVLTAVTAGWIGLAHYEWTHLLIHTRYRCRSRRYARLARNHRLHHYRNERYWLGITSNLGDRVLRTLPKRTDVPLSDTARTL